MTDYMKKPCKHCPFRRDVEPFLHPERAADIAYSAQNPYSDFPCHKTLDYNCDSDDGEGAETENTKTCAGFLAMQINEGATEAPKGFVWPDNTYSDCWEMVDAYEEAWNSRRSA